MCARLQRVYSRRIFICRLLVWANRKEESIKMNSINSGFLDTVVGQLIFACWIVFVVVWIRTAPTKRQLVNRGLRWWNIVPSASAVLLWVVLQFDVTNAFAFPRTRVLAVVADVLAGAGLVVLIWARQKLGSSWSATVALREDHTLVDTGPYAYVRHPIYSGVLLLCVGTALWVANWLAMVVLVVVVVSLCFKARSEEALLSKHFPEDYPKYRLRTKMLIPGVL